VIVEWRPSLASLYAAMTVEQENAFLAIGERANANGSAAFRRLLLAEDWDGIVQLARSQTREGAHVLDVCVDYVGRDGVPDMIAVVDRYATQSTLPLVIDSTEPEVIEAALVRLGGRATINSVNLEDGRGKADRLLALARRYGAAVVVLAIDEEGQARTADRKVAICERIARLAIDEHGLEPHDLIFDCLTFPLGSGQEDLRATRWRRSRRSSGSRQRVPGCATTLGVSNVSFGLSPRRGRCSTRCSSTRRPSAGSTPRSCTSPRSCRCTGSPTSIGRSRSTWSTTAAGRRGSAAAPAGLRPAAPAHGAVRGCLDDQGDHRRVRGAAHPRAARAAHHRRRPGRAGRRPRRSAGEHPPLTIINGFLLAGMATVGELFGSGQMQLPFVLQSAEAMKAAVAHLEPHIEAAGGGSATAKGRVVLATVKGDVHDIGKNLVDIILRNNGYDVVNLGIKQSLDQILQAADDKQADAIGMSGLLVKSTVVMRENLAEMNARGAAGYPVLLGGAALTRGYVEDDLRALYDGEVFYCKDAFEGLRVLDAVLGGRRSGEGTPELAARRQRRQPTRTRTAEAPPAATRRAGHGPPSRPTCPCRPRRSGASGSCAASRSARSRRCSTRWRCSATSGGSRRASWPPDAYAELLETQARPVLREWLARAQAEKVVTPEVVYGYYPANGDGDDLVVWDPAAPLERELVRFHFPRQDRGRFLCIADFFRPVDAGQPDVLPLQVVTMGRRISDVAAQLFARTATRTTSTPTASGSRWPRRSRSCGTGASARSSASRRGRPDRR
jgi:5-methyltetrahydrofolate--homocysteine methyltransferase